MKMKKLSLKWEKCPKEKLEKVVGGTNTKGKAASNLAQCLFSFLESVDKLFIKSI